MPVGKATEASLNAKAREIGAMIGDALPGGVGFALMIFNFGDGGTLAWISNAERRSMVKALREQIARLDLDNN